MHCNGPAVYAFIAGTMPTAEEAVPADSGPLLLELQRAIARRQRLRVWYEPGSRVIEPHCLGYDRAGDLLLRAYQTRGASRSDESEHWKMLRVDRLHAIEETGEVFARPRPDFNPDDPIIRRVIASV